MGRVGKGVYGGSLSFDYIFKISLLILWAVLVGNGWIQSWLQRKHRIQETELETGNGKILRVPGSSGQAPLFTYSKGEMRSQSIKNLPSHMGKMVINPVEALDLVTIVRLEIHLRALTMCSACPVLTLAPAP